jgi:hypothetical protein
LEHIPVVVAENADRRGAVLLYERPLLMAEQPRQKRLAGAVRPDDRGVLAGGNGQREAVEDAPVVTDDRRVGKLEDGMAGHEMKVEK